MVESSAAILLRTRYYGRNCWAHRIGFSVDLFKDHVSGLGLLLMQYYAAEANLQLSISSTPGKGTIVKVIHRSASDEKAAPTAAVKGSVDRN